MLSDDFKSYKVLAKDIVANASKDERDGNGQTSAETTDNNVASWSVETTANDPAVFADLADPLLNA